MPQFAAAAVRGVPHFDSKIFQDRIVVSHSTGIHAHTKAQNYRRDHTGKNMQHKI